MSLNAFINTGEDNRTLDASLEQKGDELKKSMSKAGLVQKDVQVKGKNGTYTRKQWVKANEEQSQTSTSTDTTTEDKPKISFETSANQTPKQALLDMLSQGLSRNDIISEAKNQGIEWKHNDHEGINWMRASMAIQKYMDVNATKASDTSKSGNSKSKVNNTTPTNTISKEDSDYTSYGGKIVHSPSGVIVGTVQKIQPQGYSKPFYQAKCINGRSDSYGTAKAAEEFLNESIKNEPLNKVVGTNLTGNKSGQFIGKVKGNIVTNIHGEAYYVSDNDIQWLKESGKDTRDIKSVGIRAEAYDTEDITKPSKTSNSKSYTADNPKTIKTAKGKDYSIWGEDGLFIYGSITGKEKSTNARDIHNFHSDGFETLKEVEEYVKKYF